MENLDLIIIGGGAAGLMAGILAKDKGLNFRILEKNERVGMKLGITGKGRCNLTNDIADLNELISKYEYNGKFLYHTFSEFGPKETKDFFENRLDIPLKVERGNRVFPQSDKALDIVNKFYDELKDHIIFNTEVRNIEKMGDMITKIVTNNENFMADDYILATGGVTYPMTGSTGDGYKFTKDLGHTVHSQYPVLVGFKIKEDFMNDLAGLTLKFVNISVIKDGKIFKQKFGDALFTHDGISGPILLYLSQFTYDMYEDGFEISIDFKPKVSIEELDNRVNDLLRSNGKTSLRNILKELLPISLIDAFLKNINILPDIKGAEINKEMRLRIVKGLKDFRLNVTSSEGYERAVVNKGGVDIKEVDPNTMRSKKVENLYLVGDILDLFGPTGGFNLQVCWSTSYTAIKALSMRKK
jgi:hypothetical protein